ncbi:MAG TPA: serine/threonine-protein kinase, partial [Myxococcota bacterium]|nr:serine/threonine-protein kinase [Myxococcota bacterium]
MAEVFVARRRYAAGIEKPVALKRIRPEYSQNPAFSSLFLQEARIALRLNHPNVVQVYDFGEWEGRLFLAMERVDGWDLRRLRQALRSRNQALPVALAFYVAWSVCRALDYAHSLTDAEGRPWGLVHQDVGHPNILISRDGTVKLTDFGVARLENEGPERLRGRPGYMSPEQLRGEGVDQRSDLYSLGVVLFELLTDQRLFGGGGPANTLWRSLHHEPPPVSSLRPELKIEVDSLLQSMLQRDRQQRVSTARALLPALRRGMDPLDPEAAAEALGVLFRELEQGEGTIGEEEQTVLQPDATTDIDAGPVALSSPGPKPPAPAPPEPPPRARSP